MPQFFFLDTFLFEGFDSIDEVLDCDLRFDDYIELGANRYLALALWSCFRSLACTPVPDSATA